jgi:hypothetical protein
MDDFGHEQYKTVHSFGADRPQVILSWHASVHCRTLQYWIVLLKHHLEQYSSVVGPAVGEKRQTIPSMPAKTEQATTTTTKSTLTIKEKTFILQIIKLLQDVLSPLQQGFKRLQLIGRNDDSSNSCSLGRRADIGGRAARYNNNNNNNSNYYYYHDIGRRVGKYVGKHCGRGSGTGSSSSNNNYNSNNSNDAAGGDFGDRFVVAS